ncbi:MFS transporter [Streptomyces sp. LHD-70]|uniref:MFS transporter n=1 Tax=Streptomyces sp. LHD-70 TaxID=3072140 RepID=UPI00280DDB3E|nr:MFS transporter [Streptomyces sp. LHD-70]MDQ8702525.1 MFS transporter [Streptomyces sp. LHD-70]
MSDTVTAAHSADPASPDRAVARRVAVAAFVGTAMEWYDFFLFTTAAAVVFNVQYFVSDNALTATMASFATLAVGFVARPVGALLFGWLGDRVGRKRVLMTTIVGIGVATVLIGLLPSYATIGVAAPIMLASLRFLQGLCVGGEWGGAVTIAAENAPAASRAVYASVPQLGSPVGTVLSSGAFFLCSVLLTKESFDAWGWRIPFLLALPMLAISVVIRRQLEESPAFKALQEEDTVAEAPLRQVFRRDWRQLLIGTAVMFIGAGGFYLVTTFVISYGQRVLGLSSSLLLLATVIAAVVEIPVIVSGGRLGQRYGSSRVVIGGALATMLLAFPVFWAIGTANPIVVVVAITVAVAAVSYPYAVAGAVLTSLFPAQVRYSGVAVSSNFAGLLSGCVPLVATAILTRTGDTLWPSAAILVLIGAIALVGGVLTPRYSVHEAGLKH